MPIKAVSCIDNFQKLLEILESVALPVPSSSMICFYITFQKDNTVCLYRQLVCKGSKTAGVKVLTSV